MGGCVMLKIVAVAGLAMVLYAAVLIAQESQAYTVRAVCDNGMCMIKKTELEAIMKSYNDFRDKARKCAGTHNET